ncbi:unnamed protein product [Knipowitschia caucasica]|uniref:Phosphoinositide 3-kinase regulatory subunit 5 n=1 Tax=Knipowitschia caucasica TaxID=637954 RepID=A0AAV2KHC4_KNICA
MEALEAEQSSCTEDRIEHAVERCLCDLGLDGPDKQQWSAGLCINRWCLEELVKRDSQNVIILLNKLLHKTTQVLESCQYDLVVPLTLLFLSTLIKAPHVDCGLLQEAYSLFHGFLSWPEPYSAACLRLLLTLRQELRAPGISFQRLVRTEHAVLGHANSFKNMTILLVSADDDIPPEVQSVSIQLSTSQCCSRDICITLILQALQASHGPVDMPTLHSALQKKTSEELEQLLETLTVSMEESASTVDLSKARQILHHSISALQEELIGTSDRSSTTGTAEGFMLPPPKCHVRTWDSDTFDFLHNIVFGEMSDPDSLEECFLNGDLDDTGEDEEDETESNQLRFSNNRISTVSSISGDSVFSNRSLSSSWSVSTLSCSSEVDSDFSEEHGHDGPQNPRNKPKKKSKSILGVERISSLFKSPRSPLLCRRAQSMSCRADLSKEKSQSNFSKQTPLSSTSPQKHLCVRRRPILSCDLTEQDEQVVQVRVVVFGGDKELGRLARAYTDLQKREVKHGRLTKRCKIHFYFVPTRRTKVGSQALGERVDDASTCVNLFPGHSSNVAHRLGLVDPWYKRNVLSLLSLSSDILCQNVCKDSDESGCCGSAGQQSLLADMVLYYCRLADQPVLVQLYQAELTLAGGEKRVEVFVQSLELGHSAGTRAVKAMGAAFKRLGIDDEQEAVPLTLNITYNKVGISGRSRLIEVDKVCTSINVYKACSKHEQLESFKLMLAEVLKRQCTMSKKSLNQICTSEVKVDWIQVHAGSEGTTFAVCFDQDEKKFFQRVVRCEVSLCSKPSSSSDWRTYKICPGQVQPLHPSYCSLLCLPLCSFSPSQL